MENLCTKCENKKPRAQKLWINPLYERNSTYNYLSNTTLRIFTFAMQHFTSQQKYKNLLGECLKWEGKPGNVCIQSENEFKKYI